MNERWTDLRNKIMTTSSPLNPKEASRLEKLQKLCKKNEEKLERTRSTLMHRNDTMKSMLGEFTSSLDPFMRSVVLMFIGIDTKAIVASNAKRWAGGKREREDKWIFLPPPFLFFFIVVGNGDTQPTLRLLSALFFFASYPISAKIVENSPDWLLALKQDESPEGRLAAKALRCFTRAASVFEKDDEEHAEDSDTHWSFLADDSDMGAESSESVGLERQVENMENKLGLNQAVKA